MSLKLTVLDPEGRIWTIVAGGGASVVYADAIAVHGFAHELANYGGYSGAPTKSQTYEYAKTISGFFNLLDYPLFFLIVCSRLDHAGDSTTGWQDPYHWRGTPNFTNVVSTFKGIIRALKEMKAPLITHKVRIFVRRSGPNYREGLKAMRLLGESLSVSIAVFGSDTQITAVLPFALGISTDKHQLKNFVSASDMSSIPATPNVATATTTSIAAGVDAGAGVGTIHPDSKRTQAEDHIVRFDTIKGGGHVRLPYCPFDASRRSFVQSLHMRNPRYAQF